MKIEVERDFLWRMYLVLFNHPAPPDRELFNERTKVLKDAYELLGEVDEECFGETES